jgi:hypothetical protein
MVSQEEKGSSKEWKVCGEKGVTVRLQTVKRLRVSKRKEQGKETNGTAD